MAEKFTVMIKVVDNDDGSVHISSEPNLMSLMVPTSDGPKAKSGACAYAMGMMRHARDTNKLLEGVLPESARIKQNLVLPTDPYYRQGEGLEEIIKKLKGRG